MNTPEDVMQKLEGRISAGVLAAMLELLEIQMRRGLNKKPEEISEMMMKTLTKVVQEQRSMFEQAEAHYYAKLGRKS